MRLEPPPLGVSLMEEPTTVQGYRAAKLCSHRGEWSGPDLQEDVRKPPVPELQIHGGLGLSCESGRQAGAT